MQIAHLDPPQTRAGPRRGHLLADDAMPAADVGGPGQSVAGKCDEKRGAHLALDLSMCEPCVNLVIAIGE